VPDSQNFASDNGLTEIKDCGTREVAKWQLMGKPSNGDLIMAAENHGFDILLTPDKSAIEGGFIEVAFDRPPPRGKGRAAKFQP
jgi:hypothetical protein